MNPVTSDNCPWCHLPSAPKERLCRRCGHYARVPQLSCECSACLHARPKVETHHFTVPYDYKWPVEVKDA